MVQDAEAHEEEDRKFRETVEVRNRADALVHATEKSLEDLGEKVEAEERASIESAISDLQEALAEASAGMAQRIYAEQAQQAESAAGNGAAASEGSDDVVDAEFEEVKDDDQEHKSA